MNNQEKAKLKRLHRDIKNAITQSNDLGPLGAPIRSFLIQAEIVASTMRRKK